MDLFFQLIFTFIGAFLSLILTFNFCTERETYKVIRWEDG
jgi:hypothetical protein